MKSILYASDKTANADRAFGSANAYYNATLVHADGRRELLRFTTDQVQDARDRGAHDSDGAVPALSLWQRIWAVLR